MAIANVTLNNTFDEWRTVTNQLITFVNDTELGSFAQLYSNTAALTVTENIARGSKNYITLNVSSSVLDRSTLNVATANAVNIVFAALANTDARLVLVSNNANTINSIANAAIIHSNSAFLQANAARDHANASFIKANSSTLEISDARAHSNLAFFLANVAFDQANTARIHANIAFNQANTVYELANLALGNVTVTIESNKAAFLTANLSYEQANTARDHANAAFLAANNAVTDYSPALIQANTARVHANVSFAQANTARDHTNAAFSRANTGFSNTSGSSFVGNLQIPTGNLTLGDGTTQGIRLHVNSSIGIANIFPQIKAVNGTQFINLNANTNFGGWNDLMLDRDLSIIYTKGAADDGANLVIGPWTDSSFGYKQDGEGRHGFNTSNPRHVLDANGTANISGSLLVGAMNVVPTTTASFAQANTTRDHANAAFLAANTGLGLGSAFAQANTARVHANVGFEQANTARVHANVGFEQANTARSHANAAFAKANAGGVSIIDIDSINATRYITFTDKTTGSLANANVSTSLIYNPTTGTLSSTLFNSTSDINKKRDITIIDSPLEKVDQLNGVHFYWKDSGLPSAGLIAQDLIKVMPELVASDMSVTYSGVIGLLVEAIKELNEKIKKLENK